MSNEFTNPYLNINPLSYDDVELRGKGMTNMYLDQSSWYGAYDLLGGDEFDFQADIGDLNLREADLEAIGNILPGQTYDYSSLNPLIQDSIHDLFYDEGYDISELLFNQAYRAGSNSAIATDVPESDGSETDFEYILMNELQDMDEYADELADYDMYVNPSGMNTQGYHHRDIAPDVRELYASGDQFVNIFDENSIAEILGLKPEEITALTPEMLAKTESAYYEPLVEQTREGAIFDLAKAMGSDATGGFAGSSGQRSQKAQAKRAYNKKLSSILQTILKSKSGETQDVLALLADIQEQVGE